MTSSARRVDDAGIVTVTLTRDEKLNAVDDGMIDELRRAVGDLGDREQLRVMVVGAEGRYFTAGIDIGRFTASRPSSGVASRHDYRRLHLLFDEIEAVEKPVVLAAQGPCLGFGVELAVSCDFRLATSRAAFSLPEIANLAVLPGSGGISRLTRLVGPHWARWMAMAGRSVPAEHAVTIGLVHDILPEETFAEDVRRFAESLAALSPEALGLAKLGIDAAVSVDRATARDIDRIANTLLLSSTEHRTAVARLAAHRKQP